jgi:hypothetical protein
VSRIAAGFEPPYVSDQAVADGENLPSLGDWTDRRSGR